MSAIVVYESVYGNTRAVAEAIAEGRDGAPVKAAAFDTRVERSPWLTGAASRGIGKRLRHRRYDVVASESFLVEESEGLVAEGELDRARERRRQLARLLAVGAPQASDR